jgi:MFS family permease
MSDYEAGGFDATTQEEVMRRGTAAGVWKRQNAAEHRVFFGRGRGANPEAAQGYAAPFMLSSAAGNIIGSRWARHFGAMRGGLRIATALACAGLSLLAFMPPAAPAWAIIIGTIISGFGVGVCMIGSITSGQNALVPRDIGSGTGALLVLRSVGGASGSTLAGAIIASGLVVAAGHGAPHPGSSFAAVYAVAALFAAGAFLVTLRMPNTRLRETVHIVPTSE